MSECKHTYITLLLYIHEYLNYSKYLNFIGKSYKVLFTHFNKHIPYICGSMHVFPPFYQVPPEDGLAEPKHEGEYTL
jgi:hypothetical protein